MITFGWPIQAVKQLTSRFSTVPCIIFQHKRRSRGHRLRVYDPHLNVHPMELCLGDLSVSELKP